MTSTLFGRAVPRVWTVARSVCPWYYIFGTTSLVQIPWYYIFLVAPLCHPAKPLSCSPPLCFCPFENGTLWDWLLSHAMPLRHCKYVSPVGHSSAKEHPMASWTSYGLPTGSPTGLFPGFGNYDYDCHKPSHTGFCVKIHESLSSLQHVTYSWTRNLKTEKNSDRRERDTIKRIFYWRLQLQCLRKSYY